jgi:hypothetical protein
MNSNLSSAKSIVIVAALVTGASGIARADDSSMNPFTGDSYAYFDGGNLGDIKTPFFDQAPSRWRQSHPTGLRDIDFAAMHSANVANRMRPLVLSEAPADASWRPVHPNGATMNELAAMGSQKIAARPRPDQATVSASTNARADVASGSREPIATGIARFFHATPADQAAPAN